MPESVPGVDEIVKRLRVDWEDGPIPLADAVAAVHAAADARTQEIVKWLESSDADKPAEQGCRVGDANGCLAAAIARRFPNGGTDAPAAD